MFYEFYNYTYLIFILIRNIMQDTESQHNEFVAAALKNFRVILNAIKQHFAEVESLYGITDSQLWVMWEISKAQGLNVSELASKLAAHQSTTSNLIEKLVKKCWVIKKREDDDQRVVRLYLSPKGTELMQVIPPFSRGVLIESLDNLTNGELETLIQSLGNVILHIHINNGLALGSLAHSSPSANF